MIRNTAQIGILGHFAFGKESLNGQTVKTKIIADELCSQFNSSQIIKIDTAGGKKTLLKAPFQCIKALKKSKNIIIFPAQNGLRIYVPLLSFFKIFFNKKKLHYIVIGGWLPKFLERRKFLEKKLKRFDEIYVETNSMKIQLEERGFTNITLMPNCKNLEMLKEEEIIYARKEPYKLCTFSRVMKEKGIEDAVRAVRETNEKAGRIVFTLDIYGQIDSNQIEWFEKLKEKFPDYVKYCGLVDYDKSTNTLKNYFSLLFPTRFYTEGIPGTIIDAYAAGVPVISAMWENFGDIVDEGKTGIGYKFNDKIDLLRCLDRIAHNPDIINRLKINCLDKCLNYVPCSVIKILIERLI